MREMSKEVARINVEQVAGEEKLEHERSIRAALFREHMERAIAAGVTSICRGGDERMDSHVLHQTLQAMVKLEEGR